MSQLMTLWYLSHRRPAKTQAIHYQSIERYQQTLLSITKSPTDTLERCFSMVPEVIHLLLFDLTPLFGLV